MTADDLRELQDRSFRCTTHHDACDCREYQVRSTAKQCLDRLNLMTPANMSHHVANLRMMLQGLLPKDDNPWKDFPRDV